MFNTATAINTSKLFLEELKNIGYSPKKAVLFGSMAKGTMHEYSDIDLAIWDDRFMGSITFDTQPMIKLLVKYSNIEVHSFNTKTDKNINPFVGVIEKEGIVIL